MTIQVTLPSRAVEQTSVVPFSFATSSPMILGVIAPGQIVDRACVLIQTPFDGAAPHISLGTVADPGASLAAGEISAGKSGQYETDELLVATSSDFLILTIDPSTSTQGAGLLFYKLRR